MKVVDVALQDGVNLSRAHYNYINLEMLGFLILRIAAGHGTLSNSHTIHVFDKHQHVDDKMYAELYPVKNILNTVTKVVHLKGTSY